MPKVRKINYDTNEPNYFQGVNSMSSGKQALTDILNGYLLIQNGEIFNQTNIGINWLGLMNDGDIDNIVFAIRQSILNFKNQNPKWGITDISTKVVSFDLREKTLNIEVIVRSNLGEVTIYVNQ